MLRFSCNDSNQWYYLNGMWTCGPSVLSLNRFELDDVCDLKTINKFVLKLLMSLKVSQEYGVWQLCY